MTNKINALNDLLLEIKKILTEFEKIQTFIKRYNSLFMNSSFENLIKIKNTSLYKTLRYENSNISNFFIKKGLAFFLEDLQNTSIDKTNEDDEQLNRDSISKKISTIISHYETLQDEFKKLIQVIKEKTKRFLVFSNEEILEMLSKISTPKVKQNITNHIYFTNYYFLRNQS